MANLALLTHLTQSAEKEKPFTTKYTKEHEGNLKDLGAFPGADHQCGVLKIKEFDLLCVTLPAPNAGTRVPFVVKALWA